MLYQSLYKYTNINKAIELDNMLLSENIGNEFILIIDEKPII